MYDENTAIADEVLKNLCQANAMVESCISPARQDARIFPNIMLMGEALVIRTSMARELFSVATLVATIWP